MKVRLLTLTFTAALVSTISLAGFAASVSELDKWSASVVEVRVSSSNQSLKECSGVLVSPVHILTAAHCVSWITNGDATSVRVATLDRIHIQFGSSSDLVRPLRVAVHPGFRKEPTQENPHDSSRRIYSDWDIAVLTLDKPVISRPLMIDTRQRNLYKGLVVQIAGRKAGKLMNGEMRINEQTLEARTALLEVLSDPARNFRQAQDGGPALVLGNSPDSHVIWGLITQQDGERVRTLQLHHLTPWLLNEMQPDFTRILGQAPCLPAGSQKTWKLPETAPIPKLREPNSAGLVSGLRNLSVPQNELKQNVIYRGRLVPDNSPLLKSLVRIRSDVKTDAGLMRRTCSGTLISPIHVLTAAHCFHEEDSQTWASATRVIFYSGAKLDEEAIQVSRVAKNPKYVVPASRGFWGLAEESVNDDFDLAIVTLKQPAPSRAQPMSLLPFALQIAVGDQVQIAGFGLQGFEKDARSGDLMYTSMKVKAWSSSKEVTLHAEDKSGAMHGDSGGAAVHVDKTGRPYIWGVITKTAYIENADSPAESVIAESNAVRIADHGNWIFETIQKDLFDAIEKKASVQCK